MGWLTGGELKAVDRDSPFFPPSYGPIVEADPAVREEREVQSPSGFQAARTADELIVCESAGPLKPIKLMVGHKMVLGTTTKLYIYPEGSARPADPRWEELDSGTPDKVSDHASFHLAEPFGYLQRGRPYVVELEIAIFETDIPPQHLWGPRSKKYKVLWHTTLRQTPKEERELPPEFREIKAQWNRIKAQPVPLPEIPDEFLRTTSEDWKRILATEITAGFQYAKVSSVLSVLGPQSHASIALKLNSTDPEKERSIFRGFDHTPLRAALYEICQDTGLTADWELDHGSPVRILITDKRK